MTHLLRDDDGITIYVGCPERIGDGDGRVLLAGFYQELLSWEIYEAYGDSFITTRPWSPTISERPKFRLGFNDSGWSDVRPPRWPDPDYPQQAHLDILVPDLGTYDRRVTQRGATLLHDNGQYRIYADPAGHPFCLYEDTSRTTDRPVVARLVLDCFSPRSLAIFYEGFLGVQDRLEDSPDRVEIDLDDEELPNLAFQQAPLRDYRHPDPAHPAQLHADYRFPDGPEAAIERAKQLGAIRIPSPDRPDRTEGNYADPAGHPFCF
jgi:Glyoxalase-like domain